jgi:hypothetical protein
MDFGASANGNADAPVRSEPARVLVEMPLKELAPGKYTAQLNVIDVAQQRFVFPRAGFAVQ